MAKKKHYEDSKEDLKEDALACARDDDGRGLRQLKKQIEARIDKESVLLVVMEALLLDGHFRYAVSVSNRAMVLDWIGQKAVRLIRAREELIDAWWWDSQGDELLTVEYLALILEALPVNDRLALLQGNFGFGMGESGKVSVTDAGGKLHTLLHRNPSNWQALSPVWIGETGSAMRQSAVNLGWTELSLPGMAARHVHRPTAGSWLDVFNYPYSLACIGLVQAALSETQELFSTSSILNTGCKAKPKDRAVAAAVLCASRVQGGIQLDLSVPETHQYDDAMHAALKSMVRTHMEMEAMDHLVRSLYQGVVPGLDDIEAFPLPAP